MIPDGETFLFGTSKLSLAAPSVTMTGHSFGGKDRFPGTSRDDCGGILVHLLHCFDLTHRDLPFDLPGMRWLPLYYCFDFRVNTMGYRFRDNQSLEFFFDHDDPYTSASESWPDDNYPEAFPQASIQVEPLPYDPTNLDDAKTWSGVFGIDELSLQDRESLRSEILKFMKLFGEYEPESEEEIWERIHMPFIQGPPESRCLNPTCDFSLKERPGQLCTIAITGNSPIAGVKIFGPHGDGVMLTFQACQKCQTIRVENQCS
ncbi:hypothetical protein [Bremerella alba]|uniref:Uncharacterized protein n=1 Tax=Bremerella alba TaxID=980252 RepID=A0A7V8V1N5_9BACT|nr:hypothetical protein [Bremerella alba]MBA2113171.1 hypothetical protein [Bremerella alba]